VRSTAIPAAPSATSSSTPLTGVAITGRPLAAASYSARQNVSYSVGRRKRSAAW
jgi:hypothetical protein